MKINLEVFELRELLKAQADGSPAELQKRIEQLAAYGRQIGDAEQRLRDIEARVAQARPQAEAQLVIDGAARDVEELTDVWSTRPKGKKIAKRDYDLWIAKMTKAVVQLQDRMGV